MSPSDKDAYDGLERALKFSLKGFMIDHSYHKTSFKRILQVEGIIVSCVD